MAANEEIIRQAIVASPLATLLGIETVEVAPDLVRVRLPFRSEVTTVGDLVHGGAIAALIDVAATAAFWTGADLKRNPRGTTIGFTVNFLAPARGAELIADARVVQRGRSISVGEVDVTGVDGRPVARALVTYKLDQG
ncbi:MAG TPA: PaaI family thioesterase [Candidatus Binatia bacterium]|jgi:uncharacterized protein (TIGR00369 family)|nr:PaaI family thioesterase [Candidatus Binatia bacterium]